jgi:hypothetical protein
MRVQMREAPVAEDAGAIKVPRDPPDNLQAKVTYGVLPQLLLKDHILDALPRLQQPTIFDFPVELANGLLLFPTEVDTGDESAVWSEDLLLGLWRR